MAHAHSLNEKEIPVAEPLFGRLVNAEPVDAVEVARELPLENRARLAAFCYSKRHLNHLGLLIASTCDRMALRRAFGTAGDVVYKQSRNVEKTIAAEKKDRDEARKITLATAVNVVSLRPQMEEDTNLDDAS